MHTSKDMKSDLPMLLVFHDSGILYVSFCLSYRRIWVVWLYVNFLYSLEQQKKLDALRVPDSDGINICLNMTVKYSI